MKRIRGILVSHEHTDHARSAAALGRDLRVPVYGSHGTLGRIPGLSTPRVALAAGKTEDVQGFRVTPFAVSHDSAEALGFRIDTDHGSLGYATDLGRVTPAVTRTLTDCTDLIVESNHDPVLLRTGPYVASLQRRVAGPRGHLNNEASARLAASVASQRTRRLVLHHLSQTNNTPEFALAAHHAEMAQGRPRGPTILVAPPVGPLGPFPIGT